jgi:hypothetical protein
VAYADVVLADGASGYWPLQETSGTTAVASAGGVNGTISGGVTLGVPGPWTGATAMRFDGVDGKISLAAPLGAWAAFGTGPLTLECWFRLPALPGAQMVYVDLKDDGTTNAGPYLTVDAANYRLLAYNTVGGSASITISLGTPGTGWHHLVGVLTRGPDELRLSLDGGARTAGPAAFPAGTNVTPLGTTKGGFGSASQGTLWFLTGDLAHVAVYKVALTPTQIAAHYQAGQVTFRTNLPLSFMFTR